MQLPFSLRIAIEQTIESLGIHQLVEAREELTKRYRQPTISQFITTEAHRQAYVISRMPATYAALQASFKAIKERAHLPIKSILDLGAGPGTGLWAACENFPEIEKATLIEQDCALLALGRRLAQFSTESVMHSASWEKADLEHCTFFPSHDLVLLSYSIGELPPQILESFIRFCWKAAKQLLLILEPGTPAGFERIRLIRHHLINQGAHLIAPCPHLSVCPMTNGDWCHFAARVERSALHRQLKGGSLGYEDEKFSYIAATKEPFSLPNARILRQPMRHTGHMTFKLCTPGGIRTPTISKKMGDLYKQARKAEWGTSLDCK